MLIYETDLMPTSGEILDLDELAPTMELADTLSTSERARKASGTITLETEEFRKMMDVVDAAHGLLRQGKSCSHLERAYDRYSRFCGGTTPGR